MDDRRTQDALDALADLFLTEGDGSAPVTAKPTAAAPAVALASTAGGNEPLSSNQAPARPVRLPPTIRRAALGITPRDSASDINDLPPTPADLTPIAPRLRLRRDEPAIIVSQASSAAPISPSTGSSAAASPSSAPPPKTAPPLQAEPEPRFAASARVHSGVLPTGPSPAPALAHVELVLLGELPGFAGPWLAQYAYRLALRHGPVGIIRIEPDGIDIDLVAPRLGSDALLDAADDTAGTDHDLDRPLVAHDSAAINDLETWARQRPEGDLIELLDTLVNFEGAPVRHWLIRPPSPPTDLTLALAQQFGHWTLLTGANPMAIAGIERLLRQLHQDGNAVPQSVKVMYLGCDRAHARVIAQQVRQATQGLLPVPVRSIGAQQKMGPVSLRSLGSFEQTDELLPAVVEFLTTLAGENEPSAADSPAPLIAPPTPQAAPEPRLAAPARVAPSPTTPASPPTPLTPPPLAAVPKARATPPEHVPPASSRSATPPHSAPMQPPSPARFAASPAPSAAEARHTPAHSQAEPEPRFTPSARVAPATPDASDSPETDPLDLSQFLALPGCIALQARSPKHPRVQLSLDETGTLHLLNQHDSTTPAAADIRAALLELLEARAWVNEHRQLIALTQRQLRFDPAAVPMLHLFSDNARTAAALAARLGDQLNLHLLQAVQMDSEQAWFHTEIN